MIQKRLLCVIFWCVSVGLPQASAALLLSEILPNPMGTDTGFEWVELINTGPETLSLKDYVVDVDLLPLWSLPDFILVPGQVARLGLRSLWGDVFTGPLFGSSNMRNGDGFVSLIHAPTQRIIDYIEWGNPTDSKRQLAIEQGSYVNNPSFLPWLPTSYPAEGQSVMRRCPVGDCFVFGDPTPGVHTLIDGIIVVPVVSPGGSGTGAVVDSLPGSSGSGSVVDLFPGGSGSGALLDSSGTGGVLQESSSHTSLSMGQGGSLGAPGTQSTCLFPGIVQLNELLPNPNGTDLGNEWIEINILQPIQGICSLGVRVDAALPKVLTTSLQQVGLVVLSAGLPTLPNSGVHTVILMEMVTETVLDTITYQDAPDGQSWSRLP